MLGQASSLGCPNESDVSCLCKNMNFLYGVRDCSNESCSSADAATVISFGTQFCAGTCGQSRRKNERGS